MWGDTLSFLWILLHWTFTFRKSVHLKFQIGILYYAAFAFRKSVNLKLSCKDTLLFCICENTYRSNIFFSEKCPLIKAHFIILHFLFGKVSSYLARQSITRLPESELWKLRWDAKKCLCHTLGLLMLAKM